MLRDIQDRDVVGKLFDTIAPRFEARPGGYTRILRLGYRRGDSAEVAQIELVGSEYDPNAETEGEGAEEAEAEGRRRPAARGGRAPARARRRRVAKRAKGAEKKAKPARAGSRQGRPKADTRGKGAKTTTPRKAGGA